MHRFRVSSFFLAALLLAFTGCGNKNQPFKEWWAAEKYEDFVPPEAQIVAEGTGMLKYTPKTNGTLYLVDLDDMRQVKNFSTPHVVAAGGPLPGSELTFDPSTSTVSRDGKKPVKLTKVVNGHRHQLKWMPEKTK